MPPRCPVHRRPDSLLAERGFRRVSKGGGKAPARQTQREAFHNRSNEPAGAAVPEALRHVHQRLVERLSNCLQNGSGCFSSVFYFDFARGFNDGEETVWWRLYWMVVVVGGWWVAGCGVVVALGVWGGGGAIVSSWLCEWRGGDQGSFVACFTLPHMSRVRSARPSAQGRRRWCCAA